MTNQMNIPDVPMAMLTSLPLKAEHWLGLALNASWQTTRMNLNTFERHGVFEREDAVVRIASRLADKDLVAKARAFPYQLMTAYTAAGKAPAPIRNALQDAMELATANVPALPGKVWILPDISGSMRSAVTGYRKGATSAVRCIDVAALVAASVLRKNSGAGVLPFSDNAVEVDLNPRDSVMTNAQKLASLPSGGTNCSAPLRWLNDRKAKGDVVIFVSDNESWMDSRSLGRATETMTQWQAFRRRNPGAKLVCLDLQPNASTQACEREDILNVGGFSDSVFEVIRHFALGKLSGEHWIGVINAVGLDG
jgi:60 kDa SS-A/Ro ribonucleoprotein